MSVADPSPRYLDIQRKRDLTEALMEGVEAMRTAALRRQWMYPGPGEMRTVTIGTQALQTGYENLRAKAGVSGTVTKYDVRVFESYLQNLWRDGVEANAAMPFKRATQISGWDPLLEGRWETVKEEGRAERRQLVEPGWVQNIDRAGRTYRQFLHDGYLGAVAHGMSWILVELPKSPGERSVAEDRERGFAPYWIDIADSDVLDKVVDYSWGYPRLEVLRMRRSESVRDASKSYRPVIEGKSVVKIYYAGDPAAPAGSDDAKVHCEVYEDLKEDAPPTQTYVIEPIKGELRDIPAVPIYSHGGYLSPYWAEPPLYDAAEAQAAHWRKLSRHDARAKSIAISILFQSGVDYSAAEPKGGASLDKDGLIWAEDASAKAAMVETTGAALEALREDLRDLANFIRDATRQGAISKPTVEQTAYEIGVGESRANSKVEADTIFLQGSAQQALMYTAILGGTTKIGTVEIPHDFGQAGGAPEQIREMMAEGTLTPEGALPELKLAAWFSDNFDVDAEVARQRERAVALTGT